MPYISTKIGIKMLFFEGQAAAGLLYCFRKLLMQSIHWDLCKKTRKMFWVENPNTRLCAAIELRDTRTSSTIRLSIYNLCYCYREINSIAAPCRWIKIRHKRMCNTMIECNLYKMGEGIGLDFTIPLKSFEAKFLS